MNLKIECSCGARYSFEVVPRDGLMPSPVQCPVCHADGTETANQMIAKLAAAEAKPRLRIQTAPDREPAAAPTPVAEPERLKIDLAAVKRQQRLAEEASLRRGAWLTGAGVVLVLLLLGAWAWVAFFGSKPRMAAWLIMTGAGPAHVQFLGRDKILIVTNGGAALRDLSLKNLLWSAKLGGGPDGQAPAAPRVFEDRGNLWICAGSRVDCLDEATGAVKQSLPVAGAFVSFTPADTSLLVVSAPDETRRVALHIDLATGAASSQEITVPRKEKQTLPDDLPPNVLPTAAVLVSQALEEQKFNKPLDAMSSEFFSAGQNLVELRVKLLEAKVAYEQSIKPAGPSQINGQTTASTSASSVTEEILNDLKRSQTGGVRRVDQSRYEVRLRRWTAGQPVEWRGEVTGAPSFFPLSTVDLLAAGKALFVFDKQNNLLFQSLLNYPLDGRFTTGDRANSPAPAAERNNTLYFFDQGVLTAFSLPAGEVRWRLTTFGAGAIQFDDQGMLYVDSTTAGPEDIQYSDTIQIDKIHSVLLKVDPASGKILWKAEGRGGQCLVSGKFLYAADVEQGAGGIAGALGGALNTPQGGAPVSFNLYRMDPATGRTLWDLYYDQRPENLAVQDNHILLRFGDNLEFFRYLSF
jgi:outer membrane protein assembly factor BamB